MKAIGLDLSLSKTGWCVVESATGEHSSGSIVTNKKDFLGPGELVRRVSSITAQISLIVKRHKPNVIVIEGYAMQGSGRVFDLAELGSAVKQKLYFDALDNGDKPAILTFSPSSTKAFAGHGKADKNQMAAFATEYGKSFDNDNECDAFFLAIAGLCYREVQPCFCDWTDKQAKIIKGIDLLRNETKARTRIV